MPTILDHTVGLAHTALAEKVVPPDRICDFVKEVYATLEKLEHDPSRIFGPDEIAIALSTQPRAVEFQEYPPPDNADPMRSIRDNEVQCLLCGKSMQVLTRHLKDVHGMSAREYRDKFNLPKTLTLASKALVEQKRTKAKELGLHTHMQKPVEQPVTSLSLGLE